MDQALSAIAPKPTSLSTSSNVSTPSNYSVLKSKSCLACRKRKVRCDRQIPCANCSRWSIECIFPSPVRKCPRPRSKQGERSHGDLALREKIRLLETQVLELTGTVNTQAERIRSLAKPSDSLFPLSYTWAHSVAPLHPSLALGQAYWQIFLERIDPLIKVVHQPSACHILRDGLDNPTSLNEGQYALLQVIYLACISAMDASDVQTTLAMSKSTALSTYRMAAEQALARAGFMSTSDWTTLQALVLYISIIRLQADNKSAWNLSGLAERLESSLEKDDSCFGAEMRRRVRWHLWYLNRRIRDNCGQSSKPPSHSHEMLFDFELPMNCHDSELRTVMSAPPTTYSGWTAMSFCLLRYDLAVTEMIVESDAQWLDKTRAVRECQQRLQSMYLRYCDGTKSIHWLASHISYVMITEMWMKLYSPQFTSGEWSVISDQTIRDQLFDAAVDILDTRKRLDDELVARKWEWTLGGYLQYVPLVFLLDELRWRHSGSRVNAAWEVAENALQRWPEDAKTSANGVLLTELMARALSARQEAAHLQTMADSYPLLDQTVFDGLYAGTGIANIDATIFSEAFQLGLPVEWSTSQP